MLDHNAWNEITTCNKEFLYLYLLCIQTLITRSINMRMVMSSDRRYYNLNLYLNNACKAVTH